jgi:hypothetical protein
LRTLSHTAQKLLQRVFQYFFFAAQTAIATAIAIEN